MYKRNQAPSLEDYKIFTQTSSLQFYRSQFELRFSRFCWYLSFGKLFTRKHWRSKTNFHSVCIFVGYIGIWRFVPRNKKIDFIINFHHFRNPITKYTFSSNDRNCENTLYHHSNKNNLDGKNSWIFGRIYTTQHCNFIMQNISSVSVWGQYLNVITIVHTCDSFNVTT